MEKNEEQIICDFYELKSRGNNDRMGANLYSYIFQIVLCHKLNYFIKYHKLQYEDSIFIQSIKEHLELLNHNKKQKSEIRIDKITNNHFKNVNEHLFYSFVVLNITFCDVFSYFKNFLFEEFNKILMKNALKQNYKLLFDPEKTILVHLRLDDLNKDNAIDFDGDLVHSFYSSKMNNDGFFKYKRVRLLEEEFKNYLLENGLNYIFDRDYKCSNCMKLYGFQSIIEEDKIKRIIDKLEEKYKDHNVIIISSPEGEINLPYCTIRSNDPSFDLYCLCKCDKIVLSRSTFAMCSLFFSCASEIWVPNWFISITSGLNTKYDKMCFNYYN
jgi:hypothetical protein